MLQIPKRISLITETASILRDGINNGLWEETLPGERILCNQMHVSRPTLRAALSLLQKEGIVRVTHGSRRRVFPCEKRPLPRQRRMIGLIANQPISQISPLTFQVLMEVRHHLHQAGFDTEIFISPTRDFRHQRLKLENFINKQAVSCCILMLSSKEQQKWFCEKGIPALVFGSCYPPVNLPSLDVDNYAVCRHAAGIFLGRGHRRIAFIRSDNRIAGDRASAEGFRDGIALSRHADAQGVVLRHKETREDLIRRLDRLLDAEEQRPTGILTSRPLETLMVVMHLLKRGISIPEDISLIARDRDSSFDFLDPTIAHYIYPRDLFSRRLTRVILQLLDNVTAYTNRNLILSDFKDGESLRSIN